MTRMPKVAPLPRGLPWVITRDADGNVVLCISEWLSPQQRREALRAYEQACGQRAGQPTKATVWGTAAIVALVGVMAALLAFGPSAAPQRLRPTGSVSAAPVRPHHRRSFPDPQPEHWR